MKFLLLLAGVVGLVLLLMMPLWWLYCFVLAGVWPTGPQSLISPGYWLFVGAWSLLSAVGSALFGRSK